MKSKYLLSIFIPVVLVLAAACSITRDDMHWYASTPTVPDIEVVGYPDQIGVYSFGCTELYTVSVAEFTIQNNGTGDLVIKGISFVEQNVTWFTIDKSSLKSVVLPGGTTTFKIRFKPTSASSRTRSVIITSNVTDKSPYIFYVYGTGCGSPTPVEPEINVTQGSDDIPVGTLIGFGDIEVGASSSKRCTIENLGVGELGVFDVSVTPGGGTAAGEFTVLAPDIPASLDEGESVPLTILFSPNSEGPKSATVSISNDDPDEDPYTITVEGYGSPAPEPDINIKQGSEDIPINSGVYDFGHLQCGTTSLPVAFTVENTGTAELTINDVRLTDGFTLQFNIHISGLPITLAPGGSTGFETTFSPDLTEEYKWATVTVENTDPDEGSYDFQIEGWGITDAVPDIKVPNAPYDSYFDFGPVLLDPLTPKTVTFTIENNGTGPLTVFEVINKDPGVFVLDDSMTASSIPAGGTTTFQVTFTPEDTGEEEAAVEIECDDPDTDTYKFKVVAHGSYGTEPDISVTMDGEYFPNDGMFYFPDTPEESSSDPVTFVIHNNGTGLLVLDSILFTGDVECYDIDYDTGDLDIQPGGELPVTVWFIPDDNEKYDAKLEIESNDPDEDKYVIEMEGYGI